MIEREIGRVVPQLSRGHASIMAVSAEWQLQQVDREGYAGKGAADDEEDLLGQTPATDALSSELLSGSDVPLKLGVEHARWQFRDDYQLDGDDAYPCTRRKESDAKQGPGRRSSSSYAIGSKVSAAPRGRLPTTSTTFDSHGGLHATPRHVVPATPF